MSRSGPMPSVPALTSSERRMRSRAWPRRMATTTATTATTTRTGISRAVGSIASEHRIRAMAAPATTSRHDPLRRRGISGPVHGLARRSKSAALKAGRRTMRCAIRATARLAPTGDRSPPMASTASIPASSDETRKASSSSGDMAGGHGASPRRSIDPSAASARRCSTERRRSRATNALTSVVAGP